MRFHKGVGIAKRLEPGLSVEPDGRPIHERRAFEERRAEAKVHCQIRVRSKCGGVVRIGLFDDWRMNRSGNPGELAADFFAGDGVANGLDGGPPSLPEGSRDILCPTSRPNPTVGLSVT